MQRTLSTRSIALVSASLLLMSHPVFAAGPSIGEVFPKTATANVPVTFTASVNSAVGIQSCNLYVDLEDVGSMTLSGSSASKSYTFTSGGSRIAFVFCKDTSGGMASGPNTSIWVEGAIVTSAPLAAPAPTPTPAPTPAPTPTPVMAPAPTLAAPQVSSARTLLKLACQDGAAVDDPCKAVYYIGADGKRHAYPNGKVFSTWYNNFDQVKTVSPEELAAFPLGKNVTYRPGVKMVKFQTLNKVYAVAKDGTLRWITTEQAATALYGADWNTKIDDIADVFYTNYTFGADVTSVSDFSTASEMQSAATFD